MKLLKADGNDSSSSDDESDSSSGDDIDVDPQSFDALMSLEAAIEANPFAYDKHVEYIALLRRCHLRNKLRAAHEALAERFPLTEPLWLACINDELSQVESHVDIDRIQRLFDRAVADYLSVPLWLEYIKFVTEIDPEVSAHTAAGLAKLRALCERAITAAGLHITAAPPLWEAYRSYELSVLTAGKGGEKQEDKVRALFHRQLQLPLADGAKTLAAYQEWEAGRGKTISAHVKKGYEKAQEAVVLREPYEAAVAAGKEADATLLAAYVAYIKLEQAQDDPARVQCVYERAVSVFPVTVELWMQYGRYLESHLRIPIVTNAMYARAVRNCTWSGALWARALRALERGTAGGGAVAAEHEAMFKRALESGLQGPEDYMEVLLARADALRRAVVAVVQQRAVQPYSPAAAEQQQDVVVKLRTALQEATDLMTTYFPDYLDRSLRLPGYWARTEAYLGHNNAARAVWEAAIKTALGRYWEVWSAYAQLERSHRHLAEARAVYKRAVARKLEEGGAALLAAEWLAFEREEGSAEDHFQASLKADPVLEEAAAAAAAAANAQASAVAKAAAKQAPALTAEEMNRLRQEADPTFKKKVAKPKKKKGKKAAAAAAAAEAAAAAGGAEAGAAPAGAVPVPSVPAAATEAPKPVPTISTVGKRGRANTDDAVAAAADASAAKRPCSRSSPPPPATTVTAASSSPAVAAEQSAGGTVSAMDEDVPPSARPADGGEQPQAGGATTSGAGGDHDMQDRPAAPPRFKDEHTVFVKGLRMSVTDAEVQALFGQCPDLVSVRLQRESDTGRSRGFAYIEFSTDAGMQAALQFHEKPFQGKNLLVFKSAPPGGGGRGGRDGGRHANAGRGQHSYGHGGRDSYGRGGGRGYGREGEGGRGHSGLGYSGRHGGGRGEGGGYGGAPHGAPEHHSRMRLQLETEAPRPATQFLPRALAAKAVGAGGSGGGAQGSAAAAPLQPKSNADFRKMLLAPKE